MVTFVLTILRCRQQLRRPRASDERAVAARPSGSGGTFLQVSRTLCELVCLSSAASGLLALLATRVHPGPPACASTSRPRRKVRPRRCRRAPIPRRRGGCQRRVRRRRDKLGPRARRVPVGLSHRDGARAASTASRRRSSPTDVDARPRTVAIPVPVVSGVRRSAEAEEVVPATCPIGWPLEGRRRTTADSDHGAEQPQRIPTHVHGRSPTKFPS